MDFRKELEHLINRHSKENGSNTPDFILADYLGNCLNNFDVAVSTRERWYGRKTAPSDLIETDPSVPDHPSPPASNIDPTAGDDPNFKWDGNG